MASDHSPKLSEALRQAIEARQAVGPHKPQASAVSKVQSIDHILTQQRQALHNQGLADDLRLKRRYGNWAIGLLAVQLVVMNAVFIGVGLKCLEFSEYVLHLYLGGTLLEVFGIVLVVTRYLFKSPAPDFKGDPS